MSDPMYENILKHVEKSVNEEEEFPSRFHPASEEFPSRFHPGNTSKEDNSNLVSKFGVFGYSVDDEATHVTHYDDEEEAKAAALELAQDIDGKDLAYVEVWQANEKGEFGPVEGSELIWKSDAPENEAKVDEQEIAEKKLSDYSDAQLQSLMTKLARINNILPDNINVSNQMDKVQDEISRRGQAKEESKND